MTLLLLLLPVIVSAQIQQTCAIRGIVTDSLTHQPVAKAKVFAALFGGPDDSAPLRRVTDANGAFCFEHLEPGDYEISVKKPGYLDTNYGQSRDNAPALPVEVARSAQTRALSIAISPGAAISGTLVDNDGDPVQGGEVDLLMRGVNREPAESTFAVTDPAGRFAFDGLPAGTYFLKGRQGRGRHQFVARRFLDATGQPLKEQLAITYFRDSLSFTGASPIVVKPGQRIGDLILAVRKTEARHIAGRLSPEFYADAQFRVIAIERDRNSIAGTAVVVPVEKDGTFRMDGLPPGRYRMMLLGASGPTRSKDVDITEQDADDVTIEPQAHAGTLIVSVKFDNPAPKVAPPGIEQLFLSRDEEVRHGNRESDGTFRFTSLGAGQYRFSTRDQNFYVKAVSVNGDTHPGASFDVVEGQPQSIELLLSSRMAAIEGQIVTDHRLKTGTTIIVESEPGEIEEYPHAVADADGGFGWHGVAPGKYRVFAFEDYDGALWRDPNLKAALQPKAVTFEINEGETKNISVPLISGEEFQAAAKRLGL
ncbi:MAG: carboxypeptidase regulatory-like domain-containing protein [Acidobacteriaceae bacterium]|nr:carboxypeptidase regulatory-like domain-containing protein [Acidobacteriaceae bacterium]